MKPTLVLSLLCFAINLASAQGFLNWGNNNPGVFRAPIYGTEFYPAASGPIVGQSSLGVPAGTTVYSAPLLSGTGYSFGVFYGPASAVDSSALTLLVSTTFRTGTGELPNGLVFGGSIVVPGIAPGDRIKYQIRAWNNLGGTVGWGGSGATYERGATLMILSEPLGGVDSLGNIHMNPYTDGWTSFSFWIPEPSSILVGALAGAIVLGRTLLQSLRSKPAGITNDQASTPPTS